MEIKMRGKLSEAKSGVGDDAGSRDSDITNAERPERDAHQSTS